MEHIDCLIIGGGPAGLTASIYLARFRRKVMVIDNNLSRAALIPVTHNMPGFVSGISGIELLERLRTQALQYGTMLHQETVLDLTPKNQKFIATTKGMQITCDKIILATGMVDEKPSLLGMKEFIYQGAVRFCPICDAYEAMDQRVGVMGPLDQIIGKALFLRSYTKDIILLRTDDDECAPEEVEKLKAADIAIPRQRVTDVIPGEKNVRAVMEDGSQIELDVLYPAMGARVRADLAVELGATCNDKKHLYTDASQQTSIPGLYAAGDITTDLSQISVAVGQAAIAACHIHNSLPPHYK